MEGGREGEWEGGREGEGGKRDTYTHEFDGMVDSNAIACIL